MSNEPQPQYQPYRQQYSQFHHLTPQQQQAYLQQLQAMQLAQQQQQSNSSVIAKRAKMMAMGFGMGAVVGSTATGLHSIIYKLPQRVAIKNAAGAGLAFGTIFAVGTLIRPV